MYLETNEVVKQYANHLALNKVSIQVPKGTVFGLLGPNGAGKTTLIRIITRITAPDSGSVMIDGGHPKVTMCTISGTCRKSAVYTKK